eukprot:12494190-Alexandrium_andersonii.AAC.1
MSCVKPVASRVGSPCAVHANSLSGARVGCVELSFLVLAPRSSAGGRAPVVIKTGLTTPPTLALTGTRGPSSPAGCPMAWELAGSGASSSQARRWSAPPQ